MMVSKILGIDYGEKRIGLAMADDVLRIAMSHGTLEPKSRKEAIENIRAIISDEHVERMVIGLPLTFEGKDSRQTVVTRLFSKELREKTGIPVLFQDERLTSVEAKKRMGALPKKERDIDGISAQIILQTYLDTQK